MLKMLRASFTGFSTAKPRYAAPHSSVPAVVSHHAFPFWVIHKALPSSPSSLKFFVALFHSLLQKVKKFAKFLDPDAHGRINFKDFCHGVFAIKGCEEILKTALGAPPIDRPPYQTDNGYYYQCFYDARTKLVWVRRMQNLLSLMECINTLRDPILM
ncbi:hypothetical protein SRHO_G00193780 [Serrasalmus rhombeus]